MQIDYRQIEDELSGHWQCLLTVTKNELVSARGWARRSNWGTSWCTPLPPLGRRLVLPVVHFVLPTRKSWFELAEKVLVCLLSCISSEDIRPQGSLFRPADSKLFTLGSDKSASCFILLHPFREKPFQSSIVSYCKKIITARISLVNFVSAHEIFAYLCCRMPGARQESIHVFSQSLRAGKHRLDLWGFVMGLLLSGALEQRRRCLIKKA